MMNIDIKKRIDSIAKPEAVSLFFNLAKRVIELLDLDSHNEKLSMNVRNDYRKRITLALNGRMILSIKDGVEIGLMINDGDASVIDPAYITSEFPYKTQLPAAKLIGIDYDYLRENFESIVPLWLKSCQEYGPKQGRSEYRRHHVDELYNIAVDEKLLSQYLNPTQFGITFPNFIKELRGYLKGEEDVLNEFIVSEVKPRAKWAWVGDKDSVIGDELVHYEIFEREQGIFVELHFEGKKKQNDMFYKSLLPLPQNIILFDWRSSKSIRYNIPIQLTDGDALEKLSSFLLILERTFGERIREIKQAIKENDKNYNPIPTSVYPLNQILYGPPGTGKTYYTKELAVSIINPKFMDGLQKSLTNSDKRKAIMKEYDTLFKSGQIVFTTFHQSMSYEDFVEGIKPKTINNQVQYEVEDGIFKQICQKASAKNGNFDEVIEKLKHDISELDGKPALTIKYGGNSFDVVYRATSVFYVQPKNSTKDNPWYPVNINNMRIAFDTNNYEKLYNPTYIREILNHLVKDYGLVKGNEESDKNYVLIIDEINRGNVSAIFGELITLLESDKRIGEEEQILLDLPYSKNEQFGVPKNLFIIGTMNTADRSVEALDTALRRRFSFTEILPQPSLLAGKSIGSVSLDILLETINKRVEILLDRDHSIGHSYFIKLKENDSEGLKQVFKNCIIPLLQEYFYGDYEKIGMIMGNGFFETPIKFKKAIFASFDTQNYPDDGKIYRLKTIDHTFDITDAIQQMLGSSEQKTIA